MCVRCKEGALRNAMECVTIVRSIKNTQLLMEASQEFLMEAAPQDLEEVSRATDGAPAPGV